MSATTPHKIPHVLVILDGIGHRDEVKDNAYLAANTPNLDAIKVKHPHSLISGSGEDVGLPDGQFGNSEVGHMNLGAGRVLYQDSTKITKEIREGQFFEHAVLIDAVEKAKATGGSLHILGLMSDGGVHAHIDHMVAMSQLAAQRGVTVLVHAFLDGRDTPPKSAEKYIADFEAKVALENDKHSAQIRIASLIGRYFAMDRDERWDRVEQAYVLLTQGVAVRHVATAQEGLAQAYADSENDEFVKATRVGAPATIQDGDSVVFMNFRADRAREITRAFVEADF
ncbi:MAG: phosphoglycerate mutase (2,3-diphosphoglycerate-independent), partial [Moraxellaceae bacterium]